MAGGEEAAECTEYFECFFVRWVTDDAPREKDVVLAGWERGVSDYLFSSDSGGGCDDVRDTAAGIRMVKIDGGREERGKLGDLNSFWGAGRFISYGDKLFCYVIHLAPRSQGGRAMQSLLSLFLRSGSRFFFFFFLTAGWMQVRVQVQMVQEKTVELNYFL